LRLDSFDLDPFFLLDEVRPNTCIADIAPEAPFESVKITCRLVRDHMRGGKRLSDLDVVVPCDSPPDVVFTWGSSCLVQERTLRIFQDEGLTGFSTRPARARSQDGRAFPVSELVVTGWGGIAPEASGIRELERCPACGHLSYSGIEEPRELLNVNNWDGSDFFMVWPLPMYRFVTGRVAEVCAKHKITGITLERNFPLPSEHVISGYSPGRLSYYMPADRAHALGNSLRIS